MFCSVGMVSYICIIFGPLCGGLGDWLFCNVITGEWLLQCCYYSLVISKSVV